MEISIHVEDIEGRMLATAIECQIDTEIDDRCESDDIHAIQHQVTTIKILPLWCADLRRSVGSPCRIVVGIPGQESAAPYCGTIEGVPDSNSNRLVIRSSPSVTR